MKGIQLGSKGEWFALKRRRVVEGIIWRGEEDMERTSVLLRGGL
jgi:hypothetical protein